MEFEYNIYAQVPPRISHIPLYVPQMMAQTCLDLYLIIVR
jgi:hypothetical protein